MSNLAVKRSRRIPSSKSPSINKLPLIPQPKQGEEIFHFSHPYHPIVQISLPSFFTCNGCKENGAGIRFRCKICEFDLHDFCALVPPSLQNHPFHHQHQLLFFTRPGGLLRSTCDICSKPAKGYAFHCTACGFAMHPCCATMRREMTFPTHPHPLVLLPSVAGDSSIVCGVCRRKRSGQVYSCSACCYHLHAVCAKEMVNGLYAHGIGIPKKTNMLGAAAKIAGDAFVGIIGGLIEGIGEGIGDALMDSIFGRGTNAGTRSK